MEEPGASTTTTIPRQMHGVLSSGQRVSADEAPAEMLQHLLAAAFEGARSGGLILPRITTMSHQVVLLPGGGWLVSILVAMEEAPRAIVVTTEKSEGAV